MSASLGRVGGQLAESLAWLNSPAKIAAEIAYLTQQIALGDTSEATKAQLADWRSIKEKKRELLQEEVAA